MSRPVVLKTEAASDLREAIHWYEGQRRGLGAELLSGVEDTLDKIMERPRQFPVLHKQVRRALVKRFPYVVYFVDQPDRITVIAILHAHRHPRLWRARA